MSEVNNSCIKVPATTLAYYVAANPLAGRINLLNLALLTRGRNLVRECCLQGSVRGAEGDLCPYRDQKK